MKKQNSNFSCSSARQWINLIPFFGILLVSAPGFSAFDETRNSELEQRLNTIYQKNYSTPILDDQWFKFVKEIEEQQYTVRSGDTLWGISKVYFGDGFYWSKLWSVNKNITNPHLIYVGDKIMFSTGSFDSAPEIKVEKADGGDGSPDLNLAEEDDESPEQLVVPVGKPTSISSLFKNEESASKKETQSVLIEKRPPLRLNSKFTLTQELLNSRPPESGSIISIGKDRKISGYGDRVFIKGDGLSPGDVLSVLKAPIDSLSGGYHIEIQAIVRIEDVVSNAGFISNAVYKAVVINQFSEILVGSLVSTYQAQLADGSMSSEVSNAKAKIVATKQRTIFGQGEVVFLETDENSLASGEVLKVRSRFDSDIDSFYTSGLVKVISTSPPYATALVLNSHDQLDKTSKTGL